MAKIEMLLGWTLSLYCSEVPVTVTFNKEKEEDGGKEEGEEGETQEEGAVTEDGETKENGEMEEGEEEGEDKSDEKPAKSQEAPPAGQKEEEVEAEKVSLFTSNFIYVHIKLSGLLEFMWQCTFVYVSIW